MSKRFLIVDDSPVIRKMLERMLVKEGVSEQAIEAVEDGSKAIAAFREQDPAVVLMDIDMPGMDGEEAASLMLMENPELKVVIVSALDRDDDRVRGLISMGAFDVLQKPVHSEDVRKMLALMDREEGSGGRIR